MKKKKRRSLTIREQIPIQVGPFLATLTARGGYKIEGNTPQSRNRQFNVSQYGPNRWWTSRSILAEDGSNGRERRRIQAPDLRAAIEEAEIALYGGLSLADARGKLASEVFDEWIESRRNTASGTTVKDYEAMVKAFLKFLGGEGVQRWVDIQRNHLDRYAAMLVQENKAWDTIRLRFLPIRAASTWAAAYHPEYHNFAGGFRLPNQTRSRDYTGGKKYLPFNLVGRFSIWLAKRPNGWAILPGVMLQALCGLRLREAYRLTWGRVDLVERTITVEGQTKNRQSIRRIPIPQIVADVLAAAPRNHERVLGSFTTSHSDIGYGKAVRAALLAWKAETALPAKDLRNTLVSEFWKRGWYGDSLQLYMGRKPEGVSMVDWKHYLVIDPDGLIEVFQNQVVAHVDAETKPFVRFWNNFGTPRNVVRLASVA